MCTCPIEFLENRRLFTVLMFQPATGVFAPGSALPQAYGDRVAAAVQGGYKYGTTGGYTPNVVADYGTNGNAVICEGAGYGTLQDVITTANRVPFQMALTADPGYQVSLSFLDLGAYNRHDWVIRNLSVVDGVSNKVLYTTNSQNIRGYANGTYPYSHFIFSTPLTATQLVIRYDASNITTVGASVGIGGVTFSQSKISSATLSGTVFNDPNGDGILQTGEPGLANLRVFLDTNADGIWQSTEPSVLTSSTGAYSFSVAAGTYHVGEVVQSGFKQTVPRR